ncbi:MAG: rhomboid family intramembrane serine protease [Bacteroidota bacterium]
MEGGPVGTILALIITAATYKAFRDVHFMDRYLFDIDKILIGKQYDRMLSSGFLHANWIHFGFNMLALLSFSWSLEYEMGWKYFLLIYFASLIGGNLLALFIHRNHGDYRALGASGAISGVIFASILLYPNGEISLFLIPGSIKSWVIGVLFILISILGIKSQAGNIGHEAHLGGALGGMILTIIFSPSVLAESPFLIAILILPVLVFLILLIRNPEMLLVKNYWGKEISSIRTNIPKKSKPKGKTLDELLEKISKSGIESLTDKERALLEKYRNDF